MLCPSCGYDLDKPFVPRSTGWKSQNHHLNAHCAQIARDTGNDMADVKTGVKARSIKRGFPEPHTIKVKGRGAVEVWKSESDCSTVECSWLIDETHQVADELGIVLIEEAT
jgi:hypothetical protein